MSVNNRVSGKIEAEKFGLGITIEKIIDDIKSYPMERIDSLGIKISAITLKKSSYHESLSKNSNRCPTYKIPKDTFHLVKDKTVHPSTPPKLNDKL